MISGNENFSPSVDKSQLGEYLLFRSFSGEATGYAGIHKITPGEIKIFNLKSQEQFSTTVPYDKTFCSSLKSPNKLDDYVVSVLSLVKMYAQSDVPVSLCLSGGIDSTVVLYSLLHNDILPTCFSVSQGLDDPDFNACKSILDDLQTLDCNFIDVSESNPWEPVNYQLVHDSFDGWVHLPNAVYLDKLFKQAAANFKVILSGEGADELLGSYNRYKTLPYMLAKKYSNESTVSHSTFQHWPEELLGLTNEIALSTSFSSRVLALLTCKTLNLNNALETRANRIFTKIKSNSLPITSHAIAEMMQENDIYNYLPSMLRRQDILSMNYSIECRVLCILGIYASL